MEIWQIPAMPEYLTFSIIPETELLLDGHCRESVPVGWVFRKGSILNGVQNKAFPIVKHIYGENLFAFFDFIEARQ